MTSVANVSAMLAITRSRLISANLDIICFLLRWQTNSSFSSSALLSSEDIFFTENIYSANTAMDTGLRPSILIPEGAASAMLTRAYIASVASRVPLWLSDRKLDENFLRLKSMRDPRMARLKRLLPRTLPMTRSG